MKVLIQRVQPFISVFLTLMMVNVIPIPGVAQIQDRGGTMDRQSRIEMHEQMATTHQKTAACLKTDKSINECQQEMMKNCPMMESGKCPMMEGMMGMMMHDMDGMNMTNDKDKESQ